MAEVVKIYWGDGTNSIGVNGDNTHIYAASGVYTVKIESKILAGFILMIWGDKAKIVKVVSLVVGWCAHLPQVFMLQLVTINRYWGH